MISFLTSCELFVRLGLVYSILAMGYYVSYTILDFPDLTVEGTFLSGAVVYGIMVSHGVSGWLGMAAAFIVGGAFAVIFTLTDRQPDREITDIYDRALAKLKD